MSDRQNNKCSLKSTWEGKKGKEEVIHRWREAGRRGEKKRKVKGEKNDIILHREAKTDDVAPERERDKEKKHSF